LTLLNEILAYAQASLNKTLASPWQIVAIVAVLIATALMVVSSFVKTMIPLRWLAVGGNFGFLLYGALAPSPPMLLLNALLLPINIMRAMEMVRLAKRVKAVSSRSIGVWLKPYMRNSKRKDGDILFRKGDRADHLYYLAEGRIEIVEIGVFIEPGPGSMFGEIAFFAPDKRRTNTARCVGPCTVLSIDESTLNQLFYQNPEFGFDLMRHVAGRLIADVQRKREPTATPPSG
jgi:CRP/FNR family transcriptional regulator, cyclic AMP receptor protein